MHILDKRYMVYNIIKSWTSPKSGLAAGRTGRRYTLNSHCTTAAAFPNDRRAVTAVSAPGFALHFNSSSY